MWLCSARLDSGRLEPGPGSLCPTWARGRESLPHLGSGPGVSAPHLGSGRGFVVHSASHSQRLQRNAM